MYRRRLPDRCNAKLFDSPKSLLRFIEATVHPAKRGSKPLTDARAKAYAFIANYVKACGRRVTAHRLAIKETCLVAYICEEASAAQLAALAPVREVLLLRTFSADQLNTVALFNQLYKDLRIGRMRQTVMVRGWRARRGCPTAMGPTLPCVCARAGRVPGAIRAAGGATPIVLRRRRHGGEPEPRTCR